MLYHKAILYLKSLTIKVFLLSENQSFKPRLLSQGFSFFTMRHKPLLHNALAITQESCSDYIVIARPLRRKRSTFTS